MLSHSLSPGAASGPYTAPDWLMSWCISPLRPTVLPWKLGIQHARPVCSLAVRSVTWHLLRRWETGYWGTMDIMHDRAGYYICWGCLVWVPSVYTFPALFLTEVSSTSFMHHA